MARSNASWALRSKNDVCQSVLKLCREGRLRDAIHGLQDIDAQPGSQLHLDVYISLLRGCIQAQQGKRVHAHYIKGQSRLTTYLGNTLVNMYLICGCNIDAQAAFDLLPVRNSISWTMLISGQCDGRKVLRLFAEMQVESVQPDRVTFVSILNLMGTAGNIAQGKKIHAHIVDKSYQQDIIVGSTLVDMYAKLGSIHDACQVFHKMILRDVVSWNAMIAGYAQDNKVQEVFKLFRCMQQEGLEPNKVTFASVINAYAHVDDTSALLQGKVLHANVLIAGIEADIYVGSALIDMYLKSGSKREAYSVFEKIHRRDIVSWNAMIAQTESGKRTLELFWKMQREGLKPNRATLISVLGTETLQAGKYLHSYILITDCQTDLSVSNCLIHMYVRCMSLSDALKVFSVMVILDIISWTSLIAGHANYGDEDVSMHLFRQMQREGLKPNAVTLVTLLVAVSDRALEQGRWLHAKVLSYGFYSENFVSNTLIAMYARCGSLIDAYEVFDQMRKHDVISYSAILSAYTQCGLWKDAFSFLKRLQNEGIRANDFTYVSILNACSSMACLQQGKLTHANILQAGYANNGIENCLVDMYAKCGSMVNACQLFNILVIQDFVSWNSIVAAYSHHGHGKEAVRIFSYMQAEGVMPDNVTYLSVLAACSHVCLVNEGCHLLVSMSQVHHVTLTQSHYACMIDLLGRAGFLYEAEEVLKVMPIELNTLVWTSLYSAFRLHIAGGFLKDVQLTIPRILQR